MAAPQDKQNANMLSDKLTLVERLNEFMQKNRRYLALGFISIVVVLLGIIVFQTINDKIQSKALSRMDEFERRYQMMKYFINDSEPLEASVQGELDSIIDELNTFKKKNYGFAAARANYLIANIYGDQKKWELAEIAWKETARIASNSYLAPIAVFNAAVAAEESGKTEAAIELYTRATNYGKNFFASPRAQFSIGRLEESRNNRQAALEAYRNLVSNWPFDVYWTNLAQSRIISLSN